LGAAKNNPLNSVECGSFRSHFLPLHPKSNSTAADASPFSHHVVHHDQGFNFRFPRHTRARGKSRSHRTLGLGGGEGASIRCKRNGQRTRKTCGTRTKPLGRFRDVRAHPQQRPADRPAPLIDQVASPLPDSCDRFGDSLGADRPWFSPSNRTIGRDARYRGRLRDRGSRRDYVIGPLCRDGADRHADLAARAPLYDRSAPVPHFATKHDSGSCRGRRPGRPHAIIQPRKLRRLDGRGLAVHSRWAFSDCN
jgi:hypothetical protein